MIVYALHMTFGLLVLEDLVPFSYTAYVEAAVQSMGQYLPLLKFWACCLDGPLTLVLNPSAVKPSVTGGCDNQNFYILVKYGTPGYSFQTAVGKRFMTPNLAQQYSYVENGTHFSFVVPFSAPDVAVEVLNWNFYIETSLWHVWLFSILFPGYWRFFHEVQAWSGFK